jgi:signal transduction histidine kinase
MDQPILLVDTSADDLQGVTTLLAALGRSVTRVTSVPAAIDAAERTPHALAILSLGADCPLRGDLVAFLTRPTGPFTPILLLTGPDDHAARLAEFSGLVDELLVRPFDPAALVARARALLRVHRRVSERVGALTRANIALRRSVEQTRDHADHALDSLRCSAAILEYNLRFAQETGQVHPAEARVALADAAEAAQRIVGRLDGALALLSSSAGLEPSIRRLRLRDLVLGVMRWARREAGTRKVRLGWSVALDLWVEADFEMLRRVVENLVDNALRHTAAGGRIQLTAGSTSNGVGLEVADTGILVPFTQRAALFERDARGVLRAREGFGPGPGLYLCRRIVEAHRGTIRVEDQQGWSNTFVVELPSRVRGVVRGPAARARAPRTEPLAR